MEVFLQAICKGYWENLRIVAGGARKERLERDGIVVNGVPFHFRVVAPEEETGYADLAIVITKITGLSQALELVSSREQKTPLTAADMAAIKGALTEAGLLAFVVENRIHVVPPCTITAEQVAQGLAIFDAVFARFASLAK